MTIAFAQGAVEWTITIEGRTSLATFAAGEVRIHKSWKRLLDGEVGLSIEEGKRYGGAPERGRESRGRDLFPLSSGLPGLPHVPTGYTARRIRTVFGTVEVAVPAGCCAGIVTRA